MSNINNETKDMKLYRSILGNCDSRKVNNVQTYITS